VFKKKKFVSLLFVLIFVEFTFSALPPSGVKMLRGKAHENLVGKVTHDRIYQKVSEGISREFYFKIEEVIKTSTDLKAGDRIIVRYFLRYVTRPGPGGIYSVKVGSRLQLWLTKTAQKFIYVGAAAWGSKRVVKPGDDYLSHWDLELPKEKKSH